MTDPYQILGVEYNADEDEIKNAYKKLVKKNHPDRFHEPDEIARANDKMTEINAAYDQIMEDRRLGVSPMKYKSRTNAEKQRRERERAKKASQFRRYSAEDYARYDTYTTTFATDSEYEADFAGIRTAIDGGDLITADEMLTAIPDSAHSAKWHFLKGLVYVKRGWLNEAYHSVCTATQMDPGNPEYAEVFQQMNRSRSGYMDNYTSAKKSSGKAAGAVCPFTFKL